MLHLYRSFWIKPEILYNNVVFLMRNMFSFKWQKFNIVRKIVFISFSWKDITTRIRCYINIVAIRKVIWDKLNTHFFALHYQHEKVQKQNLKKEERERPTRIVHIYIPSDTTCESATWIIWLLWRTKATGWIINPVHK